MRFRLLTSRGDTGEFVEINTLEELKTLFEKHWRDNYDFRQRGLIVNFGDPDNPDNSESQPFVEIYDDYRE